MSETANPFVYFLPSKPAAIAGAFIFLILSLLHLWRIIRTRKWFGLANVLGGLFEFVGLAARAYSRDHLDKKTPFIIQVLLILLAPIVFAAAVYMFLGRLIHASNHPKLSLINIRWLTKIFVLGDVFCFLVQAAGAGKLVNAETKSEIKTGENIILGGLGLQVLFFCLFILCAAVFHSRVTKERFAKSIDPSLRLVPMLWSLYLCSLLITGRNIFRLAEYKLGEGSYLQSHEWPMYGLDVALMALLMVVSIFWYSADHASEQTAQYSMANV